MELLSVTLTRAPLGLKLDAYGFLAAVLDTAEDATRRALPDAVLLCGSADGYLRLWGVRELELLVEATAQPARRVSALSSLPMSLLWLMLLLFLCCWCCYC